MSLIIGIGANLGDKRKNLLNAKKALCKELDLIAESRIYSSPAVDYEDQPSFYNQALEFKIPETAPETLMMDLLKIEESMGRKRDLEKGPRIIDIDIIFWGDKVIEGKNLKIPHSSWMERAFVVLPLRELPYFQTLRKLYSIPVEFNHQATIVDEH